VNELIEGEGIFSWNIFQPDCLLLTDQLFNARSLIGHLEATELIGNYAQ
jgi:hypothetical protein